MQHHFTPSLPPLGGSTSSWRAARRHHAEPRGSYERRPLGLWATMSLVRPVIISIVSHLGVQAGRPSARQTSGRRARAASSLGGIEAALGHALDDVGRHEA